MWALSEKTPRDYLFETDESLALRAFLRMRNVLYVAAFIIFFFICLVWVLGYQGIFGGIVWCGELVPLRVIEDGLYVLLGIAIGAVVLSCAATGLIRFMRKRRAKKSATLPTT